MYIVNIYNCLYPCKKPIWIIYGSQDILCFIRRVILSQRPAIVNLNPRFEWRVPSDLKWRSSKIYSQNSFLMNFITSIFTWKRFDQKLNSQYCERAAVKKGHRCIGRDPVKYLRWLKYLAANKSVGVGCLSLHHHMSYRYSSFLISKIFFYVNDTFQTKQNK